MPYAPGIQDISGQLIAQGMSQAGAARARAIESLGESISGGIKQYQQNQLFTNQALGKFGQGLMDPNFQKYVNQVINDDPNAPQVPDALKKAFKNAAAGKTDIYDAALLGTAAEGYQQNQMRVAQTALVQAQVDEMRAEMKRRQAVARMLGLPTGELPVEPTVSGRTAMPPAAAVPPGAPAAGPSKYRRVDTAAQPPSGLERGTGEMSLLNSLRQFSGQGDQQPQALFGAQSFEFKLPPPSQMAPSGASSALPSAAPSTAAAEQPTEEEAVEETYDVPPPPVPEWFKQTQAQLGADLNLSPEARALAAKLREEYEASQPSEDGREPRRYISATDDTTRPARKTIKLDAEGIKAILSNPRVLMESFPEVVREYISPAAAKRGFKGDRLDAVLRQEEQLRALQEMMRTRRRGR